MYSKHNWQSTSSPSSAIFLFDTILLMAFLTSLGLFLTILPNLGVLHAPCAVLKSPNWSLKQLSSYKLPSSLIIPDFHSLPLPYSQAVWHSQQDSILKNEIHIYHICSMDNDMDSRAEANHIILRNISHLVSDNFVRHGVGFIFSNF